MVECVLNILRGNVPLSRRYKSKLRTHAPLLRKIIAPGQTIETRKTLLIKAQNLVPQQQRHHYPIRRKYLDILKVLCCHLDTTQRTTLLRQACPKLVISLVECVLNILRGNVPLSRRYKSKLRKHAPLLRKIIAPGQTIETRKRLLIKAQNLVPQQSSSTATTTTIKNATFADECVGAGRSNDNYLNTVQTPGSEVLRLDDEMNKILNSSELDDRQKYSMY
ncbi:hypothetical protein TSAR_009884 [Trichomalopsis sarcophagae]|uniref:Uncharacterized protein n=1 Tax=Trichomalopsis sarcophagae TaxID=543379 RepID=A0A232EIM4_9HYME|nr:hypothetical protein TSAR_009884 [Trichomalopsis sarcophagae]